MILMAVGDHKSLHLVQIVPQIRRVRDDAVNSVHIFCRESHAAVDDDNTVFVFENSDIHADLLEPSERNDFQFAFGCLCFTCCFLFAHSPLSFDFDECRGPHFTKRPGFRFVLTEPARFSGGLVPSDMRQSDGRNSPCLCLSEIPTVPCGIGPAGIQAISRDRCPCPLPHHGKAPQLPTVLYHHLLFHRHFPRHSPAKCPLI